MVTKYHDTIKSIEDIRKRAIAKAKIISDVRDVKSVKVGAYTATLSELTHVNDGVMFELTIKKGNKDVTPKDLNPVTIHNPPILVDDPEGDIETSRYKDEITGNEVVRRVREDPSAALVDMIKSLVTTTMGA